VPLFVWPFAGPQAATAAGAAAAAADDVAGGSGRQRRAGRHGPGGGTTSAAAGGEQQPPAAAAAAAAAGKPPLAFSHHKQKFTADSDAIMEAVVKVRGEVMCHLAPFCLGAPLSPWLHPDSFWRQQQVILAFSHHYKTSMADSHTIMRV
jgi:hypothetical protein